MLYKRWHSFPRLSVSVALTFALLTTSTLVPALWAQDTAHQKFSIDVIDLPTVDVLRVLFRGAGKNFIIDPDISGRVTLDLHNVTYEQALAAVLAASRPPVVVVSEGANGGMNHARLVTPPKPAGAPFPDTVGDLGGGQDASVRPASQTEPRLTADQAVTAAQLFCRKIGQPVTATGSAVFPSPAEPPLPPSYWQPCWQVSFPGQATVQVVDATGVIARYKDDTPFQRLGLIVQPDGLTLMTMTMPRSEAFRLVGSAMEATGQPETAHLRAAGPDLENWTFMWTRTYHGIPYENLDEEGFSEEAMAMVNAHTGRVSWLNYYYSSPPLTGPTGKVTEDRAVRTAKAYVAADPWIAPGAAYHDTAYSGAKLRVVCLGSGPARQTHAAWIVTFRDGPTQARYFDDIWVDSETGRVINDRHLIYPGHF